MKQNKLRLFIILIALSFGLCGCVPFGAAGAIVKGKFNLEKVAAEFSNFVTDLGDSVSGMIGSVRGQTKETTQEAVDNNGFWGNNLKTNILNAVHKVCSVFGEDNWAAQKSEKALNASFQNDSKAQATAQERNSTATNENKMSNNLILILIAIPVVLLIIFLLIRMFGRPKPAPQPQIITVPAPAPVVSGDISVNYSRRLQALCDKHHKDYNAVLQSFGGDERKAVESMQTL